MLFRRQLWAGLADGSVTRAFRRAARAPAVAGRRHRSPVGILLIEAVDAVPAGSLDAGDARAAGYPGLAELRADLGAGDDDPVWRVAFRFDGADPREALRLRRPDAAERAELAGRLARMDARSADGPWTAATLELIAQRPGTRAAELAAHLGREVGPFKLDVRKLKALGLTESLEVGYRIAPRGEELLAHLRGEGSGGAPR